MYRAGRLTHHSNTNQNSTEHIATNHRQLPADTDHDRRRSNDGEGGEGVKQHYLLKGEAVIQIASFFI